MNWKRSLQHRAEQTAERQKYLYEIVPESAVAVLLTKNTKSLRLREIIRLLLYSLFKSPRHRIRLVWHHLTDRDTPSRKRRIRELSEELRSHLTEPVRIFIGYQERRNYSRDLANVPAFLQTLLHRTTPLAVVQPRTEGDVSRVLKFCRSKKLAVYPRGSASFAFGGAVPTRNGIVLDLSPLMEVLELDVKNRSVRIQPGARWSDMAAALACDNLIPVTSPTSRFSTVGGWISTGGLGLDSYAHGSVHASVLGLRVARPDGSIDVLADGKGQDSEDLFGTEGQLGVITEITLRVREKPEASSPRLLTFDSAASAFSFLADLKESDTRPSHVVYFDQDYMAGENILFRARTGLKEPIVPEKDAVLLHFESETEESILSDMLKGRTRFEENNDPAARYLWSERYFPLKAQRLSPGLLGAEILLPAAGLPGYIHQVKKLGRRFGLRTSVEVIVCRSGTSFTHLVIVSFPCDYAKILHYSLCLILIQLLVRKGVKSGGAPYGVGIWNTPFVKSRYGRDLLDRLKRTKKEIDPDDILNPRKFFRIKSRFWGIPAFLFRPLSFKVILALFQLCSPGLGLLAKLAAPEWRDHWDIPESGEDQGSRLLRQSSARCTSCGSCISACPAYHLTWDELATGRGKLRLAAEMLAGRDLSPGEAFKSLQCLHCGLCEEVCQTHLPLRDCYLVIEDRIRDRFGSPDEIVENFVGRVDENRDLIREIFGLDLPDWTPGTARPHAPEPELRSPEGEP